MKFEGPWKVLEFQYQKIVGTLYRKLEIDNSWLHQNDKTQQLHVMIQRMYKKWRFELFGTCEWQGV